MQSLAKKYYNPENPVGFTGNAQHLKHVMAQEWLSKQDAYTMHKPVRRRFKTRSYQTTHVDRQWQSDLVDMQGLSAHNDNYRYLLTCIDIFSRYAWAVPLKTKIAGEVIEGFKTIFKAGRIPELLQTDQGKEFENRALASYLLTVGSRQFSVKSDYKAALVERFHRTLRARMWRYFTANKTKRYVDVLPKLLHSYNNRPHSSLQGHTPAQVVRDSRLQWYLWDERNPVNVKIKKPRYSVGDYVRLAWKKKVFDRGYTPNWSAEIFVIKEIDTRENPVMYKVADLQGEVLEGKFYEPEMQRVRI